MEVNVKVMDRSMPVFDKQFYSVSVPENIDLYAPIPLSIRADSPLARKLIYSIVAGNTFEEFAIDFNTGEFSIITFSYSNHLTTLHYILKLNGERY